MRSLQTLTELDAIYLASSAPASHIVDEIDLTMARLMESRIARLGLEGAAEVARHSASAGRARRIELRDLDRPSRRAQPHTT